MKNDYVTLFNERKWKEAFDALPLSASKIVKLDKPGDLQTIRVRASEFNRDSETKKIVINLDNSENAVTVKATRKE